MLGCRLRLQLKKTWVYSQLNSLKETRVRVWSFCYVAQDYSTTIYIYIQVQLQWLSAVEILYMVGGIAGGGRGK